MASTLQFTLRVMAVCNTEKNTDIIQDVAAVNQSICQTFSQPADCTGTHSEDGPGQSRVSSSMQQNQQRSFTSCFINPEDVPAVGRPHVHVLHLVIILPPGHRRVVELTANLTGRHVDTQRHAHFIKPTTTANCILSARMTQTHQQIVSLVKFDIS